VRIVEKHASGKQFRVSCTMANPRNGTNDGKVLLQHDNDVLEPVGGCAQERPPLLSPLPTWADPSWRGELSDMTATRCAESMNIIWLERLIANQD